MRLMPHAALGMQHAGGCCWQLSKTVLCCIIAFRNQEQTLLVVISSIGLSYQNSKSALVRMCSQAEMYISHEGPLASAMLWLKLKDACCCEIYSQICGKVSCQ